MRNAIVTGAVLAVVCLAAARAATVFEIADDAGSVAIGASLDTSLTRKSPGVLGAASLMVDNMLNVSGTATLGPVLVKNTLNVQGTALLSGAATLGATTHNGAATFASTATFSGAATLNGATTLNAAATFAGTGTATFNGQATFNLLPPQVNTDIYVSGLIRHALAAYRRTRMYGMTVKTFNSAKQSLYPHDVNVLQLINSIQNPTTPSDGFGFPSGHGMWRGVENPQFPCGGSVICKTAQNGLSAATDGPGGARLAGYYRVEGSGHFGGCNPTNDVGTTTYRSLQIAQSVDSTENGAWRFYAANTVREYTNPKEVSLHVSDTLYFTGDQTAYLVLVNNCDPRALPVGDPQAAIGFIETRAPLYPNSPLSGPFVTFSITYIGE